jgi:hypothetical protein
MLPGRHRLDAALHQAIGHAVLGVDPDLPDLLLRRRRLGRARGRLQAGEKPFQAQVVLIRQRRCHAADRHGDRPYQGDQPAPGRRGTPHGQGSNRRWPATHGLVASAA